jgi:peptide/nickel transport system permease protein
VFDIQGLGQDSVNAIVNDNLPVILAFVIVAALFVVVANIVTDLLYAALDPRVRAR